MFTFRKGEEIFFLNKNEEQSFRKKSGLKGKIIVYSTLECEIGTMILIEVNKGILNNDYYYFNSNKFYKKNKNKYLQYLK